MEGATFSSQYSVFVAFVKFTGGNIWWAVET